MHPLALTRIAQSSGIVVSLPPKQGVFSPFCVHCHLYPVWSLKWGWASTNAMHNESLVRCCTHLTGHKIPHEEQLESGGVVEGYPESYCLSMGYILLPGLPCRASVREEASSFTETWYARIGRYLGTTLPAQRRRGWGRKVVTRDGQEGIQWVWCKVNK